MTTRLEQAFAQELAAEDDFDRALTRSGDKLAHLAAEALDEHRAGLTKELDPEQL